MGYALGSLSESFKITSPLELVLFPFSSVIIYRRNYGDAYVFCLVSKQNNFVVIAEVSLMRDI